MITTQEQLDKQNADFAEGWPADEAPATPKSSATPSTAFYTTDELADKKLEEQRDARHKAA